LRWNDEDNKMVYRKNSFHTTERRPKEDGSPGGIIEWLVSQEELGKSGNAFTKVTVYPGAAIPTHAHEGEFEIFFVASGEGDYVDQDVTVRVYPGDVMYCANGDRHGLVNDTSENVELIAFIGYDK